MWSLNLRLSGEKYSHTKTLSDIGAVPVSDISTTFIQQSAVGFPAPMYVSENNIDATMTSPVTRRYHLIRDHYFSVNLLGTNCRSFGMAVALINCRALAESPLTAGSIPYHNSRGSTGSSANSFRAANGMATSQRSFSFIIRKLDARYSWTRPDGSVLASLAKAFRAVADGASVSESRRIAQTRMCSLS